MAICRVPASWSMLRRCGTHSQSPLIGNRMAIWGLVLGPSQCQHWRGWAASLPRTRRTGWWTSIESSFASNHEDDENVCRADEERSDREAEFVSRSLHPHKPRHREFELRQTSTGAMISLRHGLDEMLPMDAAVQDDCPALRPASIHGRALAMRAASMRRFMRKHPTKHKDTKKKLVVSASTGLFIVLGLFCVMFLSHTHTHTHTHKHSFTEGA